MCTRTSTQGSTASAARRSRPKPSSWTESARTTSPARVDRGEELVLPALRLPGAGCSSSTTRGPTSCFPASGPTRRAASSPAVSGTSRSAAPARPGASRSRGIRIQVAYVWADALVNYLSALTYARPGKDLRTFWPTVATCSRRTSSASTASLAGHCSAAGTTPPKQLFVDGYCSWTNGNLEIPRQRRSTRSTCRLYGVDAGRFWARARCSLDRTATAPRRVHERYERELANDLGNLVSRTTAMVARYRDGNSRDDRAATRGGAGALATRSPGGWITSTSRVRSSPSGRSSARSTTGRVDCALAARQGRREGGHLDGSSTPRGRHHRRRDRAAAYLPETSAAILAALCQPPSLALVAPRPSSPPSGRGIEPAAPLFPRSSAQRARPGVIDTHAHLDGCDEPADSSSERAREAAAAGRAAAWRTARATPNPRVASAWIARASPDPADRAPPHRQSGQTPRTPAAALAGGAGDLLVDVVGEELKRRGLAVLLAHEQQGRVGRQQRAERRQRPGWWQRSPTRGCRPGRGSGRRRRTARAGVGPGAPSGAGGSRVRRRRGRVGAGTPS